MSDLKPYFKSKDERNDFYIALVVLLLFFLLLWYFLRGENPATLLDQTVDQTQQVVTAAVNQTTDADGDGVYDINDKCPNKAGTAANKGCPVVDTDGDGIADADDKCPKFAGTAARKGCPQDSDKDGVHDGKDKCPNQKGSRKNKGCPLDSDGDGVADNKDKCPNEFGIAANNGCPKVKIAEEDMAILARAQRAVEFETGKSVIKGSSHKILNQIAGMMKKYPKYRLTIEGHTDNTSTAAKNRALSKARAKACFDYLVSKGVQARKMTSRGFGQSRPIADNNTNEGRQRNRRVEFKFDY